MPSPRTKRFNVLVRWIAIKQLRLPLPPWCQQLDGQGASQIAEVFTHVRSRGRGPEIATARVCRLRAHCNLAQLVVQGLRGTGNAAFPSFQENRAKGPRRGWHSVTWPASHSLPQTGPLQLIAPWSLPTAREDVNLRWWWVSARRSRD